MISQAKQTTKRNPTRGFTVDIFFVLAVICLVVIGLMMVYSTDLDVSLRMDKEPGYIFSRQLIWVAWGIAVAVFLSFFDYHNFKKLVVPMLLVVSVALVAVLFKGEDQFNASRALFRGSVQPAELAKMAIILYLSVWLANRDEQQLANLKVGLLPLLMILGVDAFLILIQPDLSTAGTFVALGIMMFFLGGGKFKQILILFLFVLVIVVIGFLIYGTGSVRVAEYLSGLQNPAANSDHIVRSFEAIIKGGFFGVGLGEANTKFTGLPLPQSDSIFAVLAEETGLLGAVILLGLYMVLLWRGYKIAQKAPDRLGTLMAFGLTSWIVIEALLNIVVMVGLFPVAGNNLPFISYGGSSMLTNLAAIGIIINIARQGEGLKFQERSQTSATVDLRRRDWRRSVSGADRYGSSE